MRSGAKAVLLALVLVALAAGLTAWRAGAQARAAEAAFPPEGAFVEVDGRRVHFVTRGEGPDLVLIHGASGNSRDMTFRFMGMLEDRYRVTAFDRPGLGYTDGAVRSPWDTRGETPMEQADLLRAAAREIGIERPIVLGHSFGGAVAMAWALGDPDGTAAVVDVSGATMPWPGLLNWTYRATAAG
jgi:pimeloyl-ACP methyl ester carboxylesterase